MNNDKILENKTKRDNFNRKWKPYKYMSQDERKRLAEREETRSYYNQVDKNNIRSSKIIQNF
jgi:hypothetical protein